MSNKILKARRSSNKSKIRINSLQKQRYTSMRSNIEKIKKSQEENSAIESLLAVIDPQKDEIEWKEKLQQTIKSTSRNYKYSNSPRSKQFYKSKNQNFTLKKSDISELEHLLKKNKRKYGKQLDLSSLNQQQSINNNQNGRSYHFRQPINDESQAYYDQLLLVSSNSLQKLSPQEQKQNKKKYKMNLCFLNRTNAWFKNLNSHKKERFSQTFVKQGMELNVTQRQSYLHQSFRNFYKKKNSPQPKFQALSQKDINIAKRCSSTGLVKLSKNKAQNVREMLNVFSQEKTLQLKICTKRDNYQKLKQFRPPFNPYKKNAKQHHKKFMSFKVSDERQLMQKLQKLQQRILHNPQFQLKEHFCIKYLQSPVYSPWVKKNKDKLRPRQKQMPTIKPLKINQT